jgi:hypothetical protein
MSRRSFGVSVQPPVVGAARRTASAWQRLRACAANTLHVWVVGAAGADLVRTAAWTRRHDWLA